MKFVLSREALLQPLTQVSGVIERRQTLPVLANVLLQAEDNRVSCTGTDMEVELKADTEATVQEAGKITVPARKLVDICRALPDGAEIRFADEEGRAQLTSGKSRFTLSTLAAEEFPESEQAEALNEFELEEGALRRVLEQTAFAMANHDVRYYLNGLLLELADGRVRTVATDGHRLALADLESEIEVGEEAQQVIVPRKGIMEILRLLDKGADTVRLGVGKNHLRLARDGLVATTKLIDGRFPDYEAVIPVGAQERIQLDRDTFKSALQRAAILSNEKYRGVRLDLHKGSMQIVAHNPQQEEAQEEIEARHEIESLTVGFNVTYLMDALDAIEGEEVMLSLRDANSSCLIQAAGDDSNRHVVMPLKL